MNRDYAVGQEAASLRNAGMLNATTPKARTFDGLLSELENRLDGIAEGVRRTSEFRHRLMNPRPSEAGQISKEPANPLTMESRLQQAIIRAERISNDLHTLASEFDNAA